MKEGGMEEREQKLRWSIQSNYVNENTERQLACIKFGTKAQYSVTGQDTVLTALQLPKQAFTLSFILSQFSAYLCQSKSALSVREESD
jgi:hypothetical protein